MKNLAIFLLICAHQIGTAQVLSGVSARFNNSFVEWDIFADSLDEAAGTLTMTWQNPDNWTQWNYRIGEQTGTIKTKWLRDLENWEVRGSNLTIAAQPIFSGDFRQWRITNNAFSIELGAKNFTKLDEWLIQDRKRGGFHIYTERSNDWRDWIIEDDLDPSVSLPMKMTAVFLTIMSSVPKQ